MCTDGYYEMKTAKALGLTISTSLRLLADEVIECSAARRD